MNILHLENERTLTREMRDQLRRSGYGYFEAFSISDANKHWKEKVIDCIILDLHFPGPQLEPKGEVAAKASGLAGWVWFWDCLDQLATEMQNRTIIYTGYLNVLIAAVGLTKLEPFRLVTKGEAGAAKQVMRYVEEIAAMPRRSKP